MDEERALSENKVLGENKGLGQDRAPCIERRALTLLQADTINPAFGEDVRSARLRLIRIVN
ncbi:MAG: hypothetical protein JO310_17950 [Hyphomicrobiales bacterium]|nr:hypothetical protein [Hyphomicrobiales bacterium]